MKSFILFLLLCLCLFCSKKNTESDSVPPDFDYKILYGSWEISPSQGGKKITITPDRKVTLHDDAGITELTLRVDKNAVQFNGMNSNFPVGYFLHEEKKGDSWLGVWEDEIVRLSKITERNRGSVLE